ncbi:MAG: hypothetical protein P8I93_02800 [Crocinitomicaceae bacterium]|nr:hypothetical protein [Crocinitomicaceae bacterium]
MSITHKKRFFLHFLFTGLFFLYSCNEKTSIKEEKNSLKQKETVDKPVMNSKIITLSAEEVKKHIEKVLKIKNNEIYNYEITKGHLNNDQIEDAVIIVNRYEFAKQEAANSNNPAKRYDIGLIGSYNFLFIYDGKSKNISAFPTTVRSSPMVPLKIKLKKITAKDKSDILVEYRIRNSAFTNLYSVKNLAANLIFAWKKYDGFGTKKQEAFCFNYSEIADGFPLKITITKGEITNNNSLEIKDHNIENAEIKNLNEDIYTFFFNRKINKYATKID